MSKEKSIYSIIKSPLLTEKTSRLFPLHQYAFCVDRAANKVQIKKAVEKVYNVKIARIATMIVKGETTRLRLNQPGKTKTWKKALVTLKKGYEIKLT